MCVIIHAERKGMLSDDTLRQCWDTNPHGAGFAWIDKDNVYFYKGCMTFRFFIKKFQELIPDKAEVIVHFRYATHGKIVPYLTHPFPLTQSERALMTKLDGKAEEPLLFHNGVLAIENEFYMSDTAKLALQLANRNDDEIKTILEAESSGYYEGQKFVGGGSKFVLVYPTGEVLRFGNFIEKGGVWFSNLNWMPLKFFKKKKANSYKDTVRRCALCYSLYPEIKTSSGLWICRNCYDVCELWDDKPIVISCEMCGEEFPVDPYDDDWDYICPNCKQIYDLD